MSRSTPQKAPAVPTQPTFQPTTTPPGGGSWRWEAKAGAWVSLSPTAGDELAQPPAAPYTTPQAPAGAAPEQE